MNSRFDHKLVILGDGQESREVDLMGACLIGRDPTKCTVQLNSKVVSRIHATLVYDSLTDSFLVDDGDPESGKKSLNGVLVNGTAVKSATLLRHGNTITLGGSPIRLIYTKVPKLQGENGNETIA